MATDLTATPTWSTEPGRPGEPILRWSSRATTIAGIHAELARIWAEPRPVAGGGIVEPHVGARTSVLNLVVIARRPEIGMAAADTLRHLTGRHPSRTMIVMPQDPDGPSWLDARISAHCLMPREDAPETCAEMLDLYVGGEAGRHPAAVIAPLLVHDLPVTIWWPGEIPFGAPMAGDILDLADRVVVDGSSWSGDGLRQLAHLADMLDRGELAVSDFALDRQSRWREAIASTFDMPDFLPYLRSIQRVSIDYATHDETGAPGSTNIVKPVYHAAWLASRLDLRVTAPLKAVADKRRADTSAMDPGLRATLRDRHDVLVEIRPVRSTAPAGTTLRVELICVRRGSELRVDVTAEAETVRVHAWRDGAECLDRPFRAARKHDVALLMESLEESGRDVVTHDALAAASQLAADLR
jgi:glucose-6-phosphate dehydrogenase assembly protein OpcA